MAPQPESWNCSFAISATVWSVVAITACCNPSSLYHRAKYLQVTLMVIGLLIGLLGPASVDVRWIGLPLTAILGILARLQWTYYKKHL